MLGKLQIFAACGDMIKYWYVVSIYFVPQKSEKQLIACFFWCQNWVFLR
jgi:hypothetical protein